MKVSLYIILISILLSKHYALSHIIRKRQLFREQVLPHAGGKIPDSAFLTDRLALNRLQKDGIAVPDGVLLEQRQFQVFPHQHRTARPTFRVVQTLDNRYISPEGEYSPNTLATVDTTYLIPHFGDKLLLHDHPQYRLPSYAIPKAPTLKELRVPNYAIFNFDYKKIKPHATVPVPVSFKHHPIKLDRPWPQRLPQDFVSYHAVAGNGLNYPVAHTYGSSTASGSVGISVKGGWGSGWTASNVDGSSESFATQPLSSFGDYYSELEGKQRFYRNIAVAKAPTTTTKGQKSTVTVHLRNKRGLPHSH